jgi:hypothetical protein
MVIVDMTTSTRAPANTTFTTADLATRGIRRGTSATSIWEITINKKDSNHE